MSELFFAGSLEPGNSGSFPLKFCCCTMICAGVGLFLFVLLDAQSALSTQGLMFAFNSGKISTAIFSNIASSLLPHSLLPGLLSD